MQEPLVAACLSKIQGGPINNPPVANAGSDQTAEVNTLVTLDGSASNDPDGDSLTFSWTQAAGPSINLSNPTSMRPTFTPTVSGSYTFQLVVNDGKVDSAPDYVTITILLENQPYISSISPELVHQV